MSDMINGLFELIGSGFLVLNVLKLRQDKEVKGVSWVAVGFFFLWGLWNLFYYPSLGQYYSFAGGCCIATVNAVWLVMLIWYSIPSTPQVSVGEKCGLCDAPFPQRCYHGLWKCIHCEKENGLLE